MHEYLVPLHMLYTFSPLITILFVVPCIIYQQRKYGRIHFYRAAIMYTFFLYLICLYFYIITPLPSIEYVLANPLPMKIQLHPFAFVYDFAEQAYWVVSGIGTVNISHSAWFQVLGNICVFVPFGVYLHYYFHYSLKWTILFTFFLTLFCELTQLSGLYGIYPAPYRIFDINDLMFNTLGGVLGHIIAPSLTHKLPEILR